MIKIKKACLILLSLIFVVGIFGCSCSNEDNNEINGAKDIEDTDIVLFDDGRTDYKIVIPEKTRDAETFAAEEISYFIYQSSNVKVEIIKDTGKVFNKSEKLISIGNTSILEGSGLELDKTELGDSGFKIKRYGNLIIIAGAKEGYGNGNIYGAYDFLYYEIGYEAYAPDEIQVNGESKSFVKDFDYTYVPTFNERCITEYLLEQDTLYMNRMRLVSPFKSEFGLWGHTNALYILPYSIYGASHPDWYTATPDYKGDYNLCFTNEEMRAEYVNRLREIIDSKPDKKYFMLGHEDTALYCTCDNCKAEIEKYAQPSGLQIVFINNVIDEIMPWFNEKYPNREIEFIIFAYEYSEAAPVINVGENEFRVVHEDCIPRDNVSVMFAPIRTDWAEQIKEGKNAATYQTLKKWSVVAKKLFLWKYSFYASDSVFVPFNNLNAYKEINDTLREFNIIYMMEEADMGVRMASFEELRIYVQAQMMWNGDQATDSVIRKFIKGYYGEASDEMYSYYILLNTWMETLRTTVGKCNGDVWDTPAEKAAYWPHELLLKFDNALDLAEDKIASLKETNKEKYYKLHNRIEKERLLNIYFRLTFYKNNYSNSELKLLINKFEEIASANGIVKTGTAAAATNVSDFILDLRSKLN